MLRPLIAVLLVCSVARAAEPARTSPPQPPLPPQPILRAPAAERPVELTRLEVRALVHGMLAETTTTLVFHNPNGRVLEGNLEFPLPPGATVSGYALDVGGQLVDGVVVPKEEARIAFEKEVRKGVDPGLVEHVRGDRFRTRIYPIPAGGTRTVQVRHMTELAVRGDSAGYRLPLPFGVLPEASVRIEVVRGAAAPPRFSGGFGKLVAVRANESWVAEQRLQDARPGADLVVELPVKEEPSVAVGCRGQGECYAMVTDLPKLPPPGAPLPAPRRLGIVWDASSSRAGDHKRELAFLQQLLARWPAAEVKLVVVRDQPEAPRLLAPQALRDELAQVVYDGGTGLGALDLASDKSVGAWLFFSDGLGTVGASLPRTGSTPVYAVVDGAGADTAVLRRISATGDLLDLAREDVERAVARVVSPQWRLLRVEADAASLADVLPRAQPIDGPVTVAGRLLKDKATLTLVYGAGSQEVARRSITVSRSEAVDAPHAALAWAQRRIGELSALPMEHAQELTALGRRFGLVTPGTSLLVLETLEQYLEHDIEPPASRAEMRAEYLAQRAERRKQEGEAKQEKIEQVLAMWRERVTWWATDFKYSPEKARKKSAARGEERSEEFSGAGMEQPREVSASAPPMEMEESLGADNAPSAPPPPTGAAHALQVSEQANKPSPESGATESSIAITEWNPETPYLQAMRAAGPPKAYAAYLQARSDYANNPAFLLDCADYLLKGGQRPLGLRVLSNLAELRIEDPALLRVYAWRLQQAGELDTAIRVLRGVLRLRPEEPQSHRDLALALSLRGEAARSLPDLEEAMGLLTHVVMKTWDRFPQIEVIALMELNRLLALAERLQAGGPPARVELDKRLRKLLDVDVRIVLSWDADLTDVDLHVEEPTGETASYSHNRTGQGGLVSYDFTQGYGPEEYVLRKAQPGTYTIRAHYYGSRQQTLLGPATVTATVITRYGRPGEQRQVLTLRLESAKDLVEIGKVRIGKLQ
jgi:tetratricopeptide (TPR) repeat protein